MRQQNVVLIQRIEAAGVFFVPWFMLAAVMQKCRVIHHPVQVFLSAGGNQVFLILSGIIVPARFIDGHDAFAVQAIEDILIGQNKQMPVFFCIVEYLLGVNALPDGGC